MNQQNDQGNGRVSAPIQNALLNFTGARYHLLVVQALFGRELAKACSDFQVFLHVSSVYLIYLGASATEIRNSNVYSDRSELVLAGPVQKELAQETSVRQRDL